jgi:hypothetical protein
MGECNWHNAVRKSEDEQQKTAKEETDKAAGFEFVRREV